MTYNLAVFRCFTHFISQFVTINNHFDIINNLLHHFSVCLLYTSDAADE